MYIIYGDDEQLDRDTVTAALHARGFRIFALDTSKSDEMTKRFKSLCQEHGPADIFILDGHNILRDKQGNKLLDMTPLGMVTWLRQNGLNSNSKFILYSNDDELLHQIGTNRNLGFFATVSKTGANGGLLHLVQTVERAAQEQ